MGRADSPGGWIMRVGAPCDVMHLTKTLTFRTRPVPPKAPRSFLALCLGALLSVGAAAAPSDGAVPAGAIAFDIPAEPLDRALDAFGAASGLQIFYENSLTTGRHSTAVKGVFEPSAALRLLLWGTGLTGRVIAANTISVARPRDPAEGRVERAYLSYYGVLQAGVTRALCGSAETRPGTYHIALQYWLDPAGRIERLKLIGSSGSTGRDAAVLRLLQGLALPPPGDMPQPVTMAIEPTSPAEAAGCLPAPREP
jgi:hypothetical protein